MEINRWETPVSECDELYFSRLVDRGPAAYVEFKSGGGVLFEATLDGFCGPYLVVDEQHLNHYWHDRPDVGWSFTVQPSLLLSAVPGLLQPELYTHFVISTCDVCLEVLARRPPDIRAVQRQY